MKAQLQGTEGRPELEGLICTQLNRNKQEKLSVHSKPLAVQWHYKIYLKIKSVL